MGRNNADFQAGLYHGSRAQIAPGDIIRPAERHPDQPEDVPSYAHASTSDAIAYGYGDKIYKVEPLENDDTLENGVLGEHHYISKKGFKVIKQVQ